MDSSSTVRALRAVKHDVELFNQTSAKLFKQRRFLKLLNPMRVAYLFLDIFYIAIQLVILFFFKPPVPKSDKLNKPFGKIAVVGAGLTGISSAAHCVSHNFDVVIFESSDRPGGIWAHVNKTSGLQLNSMLYRFHPSLLWSLAFPQRDDILGEITRIWKEYRLESRTRFNTPVTSAKRAPGTSSPGAKWIINDNEDEIFDAIIVTIGTCGKPQMVGFPGMPKDKAPPKKEKKGGDEKKQEKKQENGKPQENHDDPKEKYDSPEIDNSPTQDSGSLPSPTDPRQAGAPSYSAMAKTEPTGDNHVVVAQGDGADQLREDSPDGKRPGEPADEGEKDEDEEVYAGQLMHSSELDDKDVKGKTVVVVGSGASGVEAVETALDRGAKEAIMIARDDKWIIPRNIIVDTAISAQPFGREMPLSFLWEGFLKHWHYRGVEDLVPVDKGIYEGTPVVNDEFLQHVRSGSCTYIRGDTLRLTKSGVEVRVRPRGSKPGDKGPSNSSSPPPEKSNAKSNEYPIKEIKGEAVVLATGFEKPSVGFLPEDLFPGDYGRPNLYLQNFATEDWSVLMTNSSYLNAIGTVGHIHIGIYTRILLIFLMDEYARPPPKDMKLWVDAIGFVKRGAKGGALGFFTYMELIIWFLLFHIFRPDRIHWVFFSMQGWGLNVNKINTKA